MENLSTYASRHSWATIAKNMGYSKDLIAEALGHEYGNKVPGMYLDQYSNDVIDTAMC
jgi:integrase